MGPGLLSEGGLALSLYHLIRLCFLSPNILWYMICSMIMLSKLSSDDFVNAFWNSDGPSGPLPRQYDPDESDIRTLWRGSLMRSYPALPPWLF